MGWLGPSSGSTWLRARVLRKKFLGGSRRLAARQALFSDGQWQSRPGGGRQARQSLVLTPISGKAPSIVCGYIDSARAVAELRSFVVLDKQSRDRHGEPLDFMRVDYDKFVHDMVSFLHAQGLDARVSNEKIERTTPADTPANTQASPSSQLVSMLVIGFLIGLGTGYIIFELM